MDSFPRAAGHTRSFQDATDHSLFRHSCDGSKIKLLHEADLETQEQRGKKNKLSTVALNQTRPVSRSRSGARSQDPEYPPAQRGDQHESGGYHRHQDRRQPFARSTQGRLPTKAFAFVI